MVRVRSPHVLNLDMQEKRFLGKETHVRIDSNFGTEKTMTAHVLLRKAI